MSSLPGPVMIKVFEIIRTLPGCTSGDIIRRMNRYRYDHEARNVYRAVMRLRQLGLVKIGHPRTGNRNPQRKGLYPTR